MLIPLPPRTRPRPTALKGHHAMRKILNSATALALAGALLLVVPPAQAADPVSGTNDQLVRAWYVDFLQRGWRSAVEDCGRGHWVGELDRSATREEVLGRLLTSREYVERQVSDSYRAFFGRATDPAARHWVDRTMRREMTLEEVDQDLLASQELYDRWKASPARDDLYVQALYVEIVGRHSWQITPGERSYWIAQVRSGGRSAAVQAMWGSAEAVAHRIDQHYRTLLRRPADLEGQRYWSQQEGRDLGLLIASTPEYAAVTNLGRALEGQMSAPDPCARGFRP